MKFVLLTHVLFILFSCRLLASLPSQQDIEAALDFEGLSLVASSENVEVTVRSDDFAVGGSYLEVRFPEGSNITLSGIPSGNGVVEFEYEGEFGALEYLFAKYEGDESSIWKFGGKEPTIASLASFDVGEDGSKALVIALEGSYGLPVGEKVVRLDDFRFLADRFHLEVDRSEARIVIEPDREVFRPGEIVHYRYSPLLAHRDEFDRWTSGNYGRQPDTLGAAGEEGFFVVEGHTSLVPRVLSWYRLGDLEVGIPKSTMLQLIDVDGERWLDIVEGSELDIRLRGEGPGELALRLGGRRDDSELRIGEGANVLDTLPVLELGRGVNVFEAQIQNYVRFGPSYVNGGSPLELNVLGRGEVLGVPENLILEDGRLYRLEAVPVEGWTFGGWSGSMLSDAAELELLGGASYELIAEFFEPLPELKGAGLRGRGPGGFWSADDGELRGEGLLSGDDTPVVEWSLQGPGEVEFEVRTENGTATFLINGSTVSRSYEGEVTPGYRKYRASLLEGQNELRISIGDASDDDADTTFHMDEIVVLEGWKIDVVARVGGTVESNLEGRERLGHGESLEALAKPNEGYRFGRWEGLGYLAEEELSLMVYEDVYLTAVFEKVALVGDGEVGLSGNADWTLEEGVWVSPTGLSKGEAARVTFASEGAFQLQFSARIDAGLDVWWGIDGVVAGKAGTLNALNIPEGAESYFFEVRNVYGGADRKAELWDLGRYHLVELDVEGTTLSTSPALEVSSTASGYRYSGYVEEGTMLEYQHSGGDLVSWSGDLEGMGENGSFLVDRALKGKAKYKFGGYYPDSDGWRVSPVESVSLKSSESGVALEMADASEVVVLSKVLNGPGLLRVRYEGPSLGTLYIDGEEAFPDFPSLRGVKAFYSNGGVKWVPWTESFSLPKGDVLVEIHVERTSPVSTAASNANLVQGIAEIELLYGWLVTAQKLAGGSIQSNPELEIGIVPATIVEDGEEIELTAVPDPRNRFVEWQSPFESENASFTAAVNDNLILSPRFEVDDLSEFSPHSWGFEGERPAWEMLESEYNQIPDIPLFGSFVYRIPVVKNSIQGVHSTQIEGPAVLGFTWSVSDALSERTFPISGGLRVDGGAWEIDMGFNEVGLGEGLHDIEWWVDLDDSFGRDVQVSVTHPSVGTEFALTVEGQGAEVTINELKEFYAFGEVVTIEAPEVNEGGAPFLGWWKLGSRYRMILENELDPWSGGPDYDEVEFWRPAADFYSEDRVLQYEIDLNPMLVAVYSSNTVRSENALTWMDGVGEFEFEEVMDLSEADGYNITVFEDSVINFEIRNASSREFLVIGFEDVKLPELSEWTEVSLFLAAGENLSFEGVASAELRDVSIRNGWGPSIIKVGSGQLEMSRLPLGMEEGESLVLSVENEGGTDFVDWFEWTDPFDSPPSYYPDSQKLTGLETNSVTMDYGDRRVLFPTWQQEYSTDLGTFRIEPHGSWVEYPVLSDPRFWGGLGLDRWQFFRNAWGEGAPPADGANWVTGESVPAEEEAKLSTIVIGPATVMYVTRGIIDVRLFNAEGEMLGENLSEDSKVDFPFLESEYEKRLLVPTGQHELEFTKREHSDSVRILNLRIEAGYPIEGREYACGRVAVWPEGLVRAEGESVIFSAVPKPGYRFVRWEGEDLGKPSGFEEVITGYKVPVPVFELSQSEAELGGMTWVGMGVEFERTLSSIREDDAYKGTAQLKANHLAGESAWIETEIVGPAVLRASGSFFSGEVQLDGEPVSPANVVMKRDWDVLSQALPSSREYRYLAIPEGVHRVRRYLAGSLYAPIYFVIDEDLTVFPGYMLSVSGLGVELHVRPEKVAYHEGEYVEILAGARKETEDELDWRGLPAGVTPEGGDVRFAISDHTRVEVLRWKKARFSGIDLETAGEADWTYGKTGTLTLAEERFFEPAYLRFGGNGPKILKIGSLLSEGSASPYASISFSNSNFAEAFRNGASEFIGLYGPEDYAQLRLSDYSNRSGLESVLEGLTVLDPENSAYGRWWLENAELVSNPVELLQQWSDLDEDGVPAYLEFLNDWSVSKVEGGFQAQVWSTGQGITFELHPEIARDFELFEIEYATSLNGEWNSIHRSSLVEAGENRYAWLGMPKLEAIVSLYFRMRFADDLPTLESLLEN